MVDMTSMLPIFAIAEVENRFEPGRNGEIKCIIVGHGGGLIDVKLTSPFVSRGEAGFDGLVPGQGVQLIVMRMPGDTAWYMVNCVYSQEPPLSKGANETITELGPSQRNLGDVIGGSAGAGTGDPNKVQLQGIMGGGVAITGQRRPDAMNIKTEVYTGTGKSVALVDDPEKDYILTDAGSKAGTSRVTITSDREGAGNDILAANAFQVETTGPQRLLNDESQTDVLVTGRELQLLNNATGEYAPSGAPEDKYWGNVNIQSTWNDVNIFSRQPRLDAREEGKDGRIFIETLNTSGLEQVIQIQTHGTLEDQKEEPNCVIRIKSSGKIEIQTVGDLDIECGRNINMRAQGKISMEAGDGIEMLGGTDNINMGAPEIHLNSNTPAPKPPIMGQDLPYYKEDGITTF